MKKKDPTSHRIIEKRRRDRMNNCLADLSKLIPAHYMKKGRGRVEKTEIIEMAIRHLKDLIATTNAHQATTGGSSTSSSSSIASSLAPVAGSATSSGMPATHQPREPNTTATTAASAGNNLSAGAKIKNGAGSGGHLHDLGHFVGQEMNGASPVDGYLGAYQQANRDKSFRSSPVSSSNGSESSSSSSANSSDADQNQSPADSQNGSPTTARCTCGGHQPSGGKSSSSSSRSSSSSSSNGYERDSAASLSSQAASAWYKKAWLVRSFSLSPQR